MYKKLDAKLVIIFKLRCFYKKTLLSQNKNNKKGLSQDK